MPRPDPAPRGAKFIILASICVVIAALWFMQDVLIPLALAVLITFLFTPVVHRLEKWGFGRIGSVFAIMSLTVAVIGVLGYIAFGQVLTLATDLPKYQDEIVAKVSKLRPSRGGVVDQLSKMAEEVPQRIEGTSTRPATSPAQKIVDEITDRTDAAQVRSEEDLPATLPAEIEAEEISPDAREAMEVVTLLGGPWTRENPFPTASVDPKSPLDKLGAYMGVFLGPLGTFGLVVVFVIFMLIQREDLRDRLIRLLGQGQLSITTQALDDASTRISRYLLAQAIVNGTYGIGIGFGLWLIGKLMGNESGGDPESFPNFVLWGIHCAILRFIPYIGPWIAAAFPIAVAFAVYHGYGVFIATGAMFIVIELLSNNLMEPWLYGSSTGMSTIAVLVSAVFWTFLWGPVGLLLATPLTVCLVVLGKYVPQMGFLDVLLGDEPVLLPHERAFQRLLAMDQEEIVDLADEYLEDHSLEELYDQVLVPALGLAEHERHRGKLDEQRQRFIRNTLRQLIDELGDRQRLADEARDRAEAKATHTDAADAVVAAARGTPSAPPEKSKASDDNGKSNSSTSGAPPDDTSRRNNRRRVPKECTVNIVTLPAHDEADEIVGLMITQLLELQGYCASNVSVTALAGEMIELVKANEADLVCVSAMPPAAVAHSRYLCKRIHLKFPDIRMVVGLWTYKSDLKRATERITCAGSVAVVTALTEALDEIHQQVQPLLIHAQNSDKPAEGRTVVS
jgi:predicted PurR-regulated permease PerM